MPIVSLQNILSSKQFPPIILLFGQEEFLLDEAYDSLISSLVKTENDKFNFDILDGEENTQDQIASICSSFPMMSDKRVVVLKNIDKLFTGKSKKQETNALSNYLRNPSPHTILILKTRYDKLFGVSKKMKAQAPKGIKYPFPFLLENHAFIEFTKKYDNEFPDWLYQRFKKYGKNIDQEALQMVLAQSGESLRHLANEVDKIVISYPDKQNITKDDVNFLLGATKNYTAADLQNAVGDRNLNQALFILDRLLSVNDKDSKIIPYLTNFFIAAWKLIELASKGLNNYEIASRIKVNAYFLQQYQKAIRIYKHQEIANALIQLTKADEALKTSAGDGRVIFQNLIMNINKK
jgi:DNA polymerase-3 subunit delta